MKICIFLYFFQFVLFYLFRLVACFFIFFDFLSFEGICDATGILDSPPVGIGLKEIGFDDEGSDSEADFENDFGPSF